MVPGKHCLVGFLDKLVTIYSTPFISRLHLQTPEIGRAWGVFGNKNTEGMCWDKTKERFVYCAGRRFDPTLYARRLPSTARQFIRTLAFQCAACAPLHTLLSSKFALSSDQQP